MIASLSLQPLVATGYQHEGYRHENEVYAPAAAAGVYHHAPKAAYNEPQQPSYYGHFDTYSLVEKCKPKNWAAKTNVGGRPNWGAGIVFLVWGVLWGYSALRSVKSKQRFDVVGNNRQADFRNTRKLSYAAFMALLSGFVNANTGKRFGTYGGFMTGNSVKMGMAMADDNWGSGNTGFGFYAAWITAFFLGAFLAWNSVWSRKQGSFQWLGLLVGLSFLVLELLANYADWHKWASILSPFAQGIVNPITVMQIAEPTTFMTGRVMNGARGIAVMLRVLLGLPVSILDPKLLDALVWQARVIAVVYTSFVVGAIPGVWVTEIWCGGEWSLLLPAAAYAIAIYYVETFAIEELNLSQAVLDLEDDDDRSRFVAARTMDEMVKLNRE